MHFVASAFCKRLTCRIGPSFSCHAFRATQATLAVVAPPLLSLICTCSLGSMLPAMIDQACQSFANQFFVCAWSKCRGRGRSVALNVIKEAVAH